ncbi:cadherin repeat domain-containing protein [Corallococcus exiguus]|uniref:Ig-like domain-containing protein n=1 Tax=Corallococcus TaxID=83461 RepID=UPI000ECC81C5|nr:MULTISPECIES: Ig-like domain-containing protein [Corallococcus]NPC76175.1 cadherin repeat domain-containing protein [Corallococcus exiguus]RKH99379.1 cadherin repeat domain-containing protein [Corallococcus sp. AB038B]
MSMVSRRFRRLAVALVGAGAWVSAGCGELPTPQENTPSQVVIQDAAVLNDSTRTEWSFGQLVTAMSGPVAPSDFVRDNLPRWAGQDATTGTLVARLLETWPTLADGSLDLAKAPLRLESIVHHPEAFDVSRGSAGEARFVFGGVDASGNPLGLTVTLNYVLAARTPAEARDWTQRWQDLASRAPGSEAYKTALQALTDRVTTSPGQGRVAAASSNPRQQVGALLLDDTTPPSVAISSPAPASFLRGTFVITANASDDVGVTQVDFYDGATLIGSSTAAPFSVNWNTTGATSGNHTLTAQAFDAAGNSTTSSAVTVLVDNFAPVIITGVPQYNPTSQSYVRGIVTVGWSVTDQSLSGVAQTEFMQEGIVKATAPGYSGLTYNFTWDTRVLGNRSYSLALRATDNAGNVQTSTRSLIVDNQLPTSTLTSPANGAVVSGNVTLTANASDTQAMLQVVFEIDGVSTYFVGSSPYTRTWNTAGLSGTHTIVAIAYDRAGNSRRSNAVTVTVP